MGFIKQKALQISLTGVKETTYLVSFRYSHASVALHVSFNFESKNILPKFNRDVNLVLLCVVDTLKAC